MAKVEHSGLRKVDMFADIYIFMVVFVLTDTGNISNWTGSNMS